MDNIKITFSSKVFFIISALAVLVSISSAYYRYMILEDYEIFFEIDDQGQLINIDE